MFQHLFDTCRMCNRIELKFCVLFLYFSCDSWIHCLVLSYVFAIFFWSSYINTLSRVLLTCSLEFCLLWSRVTPKNLLRLKQQEIGLQSLEGKSIILLPFFTLFQNFHIHVFFNASTRIGCHVICTFMEYIHVIYTSSEYKIKVEDDLKASSILLSVWLTLK